MIYIDEDEHRKIRTCNLQIKTFEKEFIGKNSQTARKRCERNLLLEVKYLHKALFDMSSLRILW